MEITLGIAKKLIHAGIKEALLKGNPCTIAVVDGDGWLVAAERMDGALIPTFDIARDKAWTALAFKMPSSDIYKFGDSTMPGFGFNTTGWNDRITPLAGGLPIKDGNEVIGAVGVSGNIPKQDIAVCKTAVDAIL
ncbi:MAG: heme-binding protein [Thermodesulfobacteriota bacterium]|nr:heme-binding protein [Thermodesulfobacteriota bacterium]